jgi:hypothetical protein
MHWSDPPVRRRLLLGAGSPSTMEQVVGGRVGSEDWQVRLERELGGVSLRPNWLPYIAKQAVLGLTRGA